MKIRRAACIACVLALSVLGLSTQVPKAYAPQGTFLCRTHIRETLKAEAPADPVEKDPDITVKDAPAASPGPAWSYEEQEALAKTMWGEARGCPTAQTAAVAWCALNRVDDPRWADDILSVLTQKNQFCGYDPENPVDPDLMALAADVLERWHAAKASGQPAQGRTLPEDYYYFTGDGYVNWFRKDYLDDGVYWDWSLPDPYAVQHETAKDT